MQILNCINGHGHSNVNSLLWGEFNFMLASSVIQRCGWCPHKVQNLAPLLEIVYPSLPLRYGAWLTHIPASGMHLENFPWKTQRSPQPKVACLALGALVTRAWPQMEETRQCLVPIPILYLQVVPLPSTGALLLIMEPMPVPSGMFTLEQQCKSWKVEKKVLLFSY